MSNNSYFIMSSDKNPNPDFIPPPTTGSNAISPKVGTKCPYRKVYLPKTWWDGAWCRECLMKSTRIEEEFQDCIGKDCICWTPIGCSRK